MPTGIQLSSGVVVGQPVALDAKFGPYNSVADALNDLTSGLRYRGLTVGVYESGALKEYWFREGTGNEHFVAKSSDVTWDSLLNKPSIPAASTVTPQPSGSSAVGSASTYARADHRHAHFTLIEDDADGLTQQTPKIISVAQSQLPCRIVLLQNAEISWTRLVLPYMSSVFQGDFDTTTARTADPVVAIRVLNTATAGSSCQLRVEVGQGDPVYPSSGYDDIPFDRDHVFRWNGEQWVYEGKDVENLQIALNGKANTAHTHTIENVTGLQTALDAKEDEPVLFTVTQDNQTIPTGHRLVRVVAEVPSGAGNWTLNLPAIGALKGDTVFVETLSVAGSGQSLTLVSTPTDSGISVRTVVLGSYETLVARFNGFAWSQVTRDTFVSPIGRDLMQLNAIGPAVSVSGGSLNVNPKSFVTVVDATIEGNSNYSFPNAPNIRLNATAESTSTATFATLRLPPQSSRQLYDRIEVWLVAKSESVTYLSVRLSIDDLPVGIPTEGLAFLNTVGQAAAFILEPSGWQLYPVSQHTHPDATTTAAGFLSTADKTKLDGIADGAEVNVNADWNATSGDAQILNKPSTFPPSSHTHDSLQSGSGTTLDTFTLKSGGVNGLFLAKTFNTSDPSLGIESYNTSNVRIGYALLGIRSTNGFLQGGSNTFRIEQSGGSLARLQLSSIVNSSGNQLSLPSTAGTLALTSGVGSPVELVIACSDETSNLTVGANKVTFRAPYAFTLTGVRASVNTAPTGSTLIVDINEAGTSVLSTKLSIDANETTSTTATSAAVISDSSIVSDAEITIDIDQVGSSISGKGLKVVLIGTRA